MHCPDQAWAILEVLPRSQIDRLDLDLIAKKYPAHMMQLLMREKAEEDEEEEGGKGQRGRTAEGATQSPASKAAKRSMSMTPSIAAREAPVEAGAEAGTGVSARPSVPAVYDLIQRKAFMSSEDARDKLCRGLKRRLHTLSDTDLLQVRSMGLCKGSGGREHRRGTSLLCSRLQRRWCALSHSDLLRCFEGGEGLTGREHSEVILG